MQRNLPCSFSFIVEQGVLERHTGGEEFARVPNTALRDSSLEAWAAAFLAEAQSELDDLRGDLLIECFAESAPGADTEPVHSAQVPLKRP